jgi:hypothetical protein
MKCGGEIMALLEAKEVKVATSIGGFVGPMLRHTNSGGRLVYAIGSEFPFREFGNAMGTSGTIGMAVEYQNHIGFSIQLSMFKWVWLIIPKHDVIEWGILTRGSIPTSKGKDRSSTIAGVLLYGPIGALVGSAMDNAASVKQDQKPVIGITYQSGDSQSAVFIDFQLNSWYYKFSDFLMTCLADKHRE